jgi:hypothetical protein
VRPLDPLCLRPIRAEVTQRNGRPGSKAAPPAEHNARFRVGTDARCCIHLNRAWPGGNDPSQLPAPGCSRSDTPFPTSTARRPVTEIRGGSPSAAGVTVTHDTSSRRATEMASSPETARCGSAVARSLIISI